MKLNIFKNILVKMANNILNRQEDWIILARRRYAQSSLSKKKGNITPLTETEENEIIKFWQKYHKKATSLFSIKQYSVYKTHLSSGGGNLKHYIPDDFYYCYADNFFTNYHISVRLDNKNLYDLYFHNVNMPVTVIRRIEGIFMDRSYQQISINQAIDACCHTGNVIIKQSLNSDGGKGIRFVEQCSSHRTELKSELTGRDNYVVQTIVRQHPVLAVFNPQSVNTIRIMTLFYRGEAKILSSVLRMGINGSKVDNASSGGIVCGIKPDGTLRDCAFDACANKYDKHPQGHSFSGVVIPSFEKCKSLAQTLSCRFVNYTKLISWDFSVDEQGEPLLIEANFTGGQLDFHQLCNGPIWGNDTEAILANIFANSKDIIKRL